MNINIPKNVELIINTLEQYGYEAYIVGGCVRDSILERKPKDWDITTNALPQDILNIFDNYKIIETGLQHGTVTIVINKEPYEVTTYRIDGTYSDNRRPDAVEFTASLEEDLSRRDLTINAMAYNHKTGLIDPFNGMIDIQGKVIRCVGNGGDRFKEDALRILRAMRFSMQLDFRIAKHTFKAMIINKSSINNVSAERINSELVKMLQSKNSVSIYFQGCRDIIAEFIPEFIPCFDFKQNNPYHEFDVYSHILRAVDNYKGDDIMVKLSLLLHDIGKPDCYSEDKNGGHFIGHGMVSSDKTNIILKRLKFDNETIESVTQLVLYHDSTIEPTSRVIKRWLNKIGEIQFRRLLEIRTADILAHSSINRSERIEKQSQLFELLEMVINEKQCFTISDLNINGKDLIEIGYKQGKQLGEVLEKLLNCVITDEVENSKGKLILVAEEWRI